MFFSLENAGSMCACVYMIHIRYDCWTSNGFFLPFIAVLYFPSRLRDITNSINKHYELLRLIVRKMDISTEDDHKDEGVDTSVESDNESGIDNSHVVNGWSSDLVRNNLLKRTAVLSYKQNKNMKKQNWLLIWLVFIWKFWRASIGKYPS